MINLINGDCLEKLKLLEDDSIDSCVTDAPYGLAFMGKKWDYDVPSVEIWKEVLRVLKPGGHLLSFGGTRTYHRMVINVENAGFEIRDMVTWNYGSGFPKSMNIEKALIKQGLSEEIAKDYSGQGTALKPALEPICLARKPISEKTVAANVLKHGTGAMNIDESRVETSDKQSGTSGVSAIFGTGEELPNIQKEMHAQGRWPANVIFDEEAGKILDEQTGILSSGGQSAGTGKNINKGTVNFGGNFIKESTSYTGEKGGASRFFYCAKSSKSERGTENIHPTVKPIKLMEYLCKLVTPPNGVVLDPFMGSGTTGKSAKNLGFKFIGIEKDEIYFKIAEARINE